MKYREVLPDDCPPSAAEAFVAVRIVYRLVATNPPTDADFQSQRALKPDAKFHVPECQARGLSVHAARADSVKARKLPALKGRLIGRMNLGPGAGAIQQTGKPSHQTWWPLADFDAIGACVVEAA